MRSVRALVCVAIISFSLSYTNGHEDNTRECDDGLGICTGAAWCCNNTAFSDGRFLLNMRFEVELEPCHYMEVCCNTEDVISPPTEPKRNVSGSDEKLQPTTINPEGLEGTEGGHKIPRSLNDTCGKDDATCIPFFFCEIDTTIDGAGIFESRFSSDESTTDGAELITSRFSTDNCAVRSQVCCPKERNIILKTPPGCGHRNEKGLGFLITDHVDEAQYAEFPWMAALSTKNADGSSNFICGGSLIHPHVILTAAHCVHNIAVAEMLTVRLGEWDTQTTNEIFPHSDHKVDKIIIHEEFGKVNLFNDVALLVLKTHVKLSSHVNTICLPPKNIKLNKDTCYASGWGADKFGTDGLYRVNLKKLKMPIVRRNDCQEKLRTSKLGPYFRLHTSFMCAGGEKDVDTCTGDGGSPLVCSGDGETGTFFQVGAVAWGIECGKEGLPGVYAKIPEFRDWIDAKMIWLGYDTTYYTPKDKAVTTTNTRTNTEAETLAETTTETETIATETETTIKTEVDYDTLFTQQNEAGTTTTEAETTTKAQVDYDTLFPPAE